MPVSCGSVGDVIAVCQLVKDLIAALNDCRGSSGEFNELVKELQSLARALHEVNVLATKHEGTQELYALVEAARAAAQGCRESINRMLKRVRRYQDSLRLGGSGNAFKDTARKVQWRILEKEEVDRFRAEVTAHANSLNIVLISASIVVTQVEGRRTRDEVQKTCDRLRTSDSAQDQVLAKILARVEDLAIQTRSESISLRSHGLKYLATVFKTMMTQISSSIFAVYQKIATLEMSIGNLRTQSLLIQSPCILLDALGRITPISLQFVNSWDAFDAVLEVRFRKLPGHAKVCNKEFVLQDSQTARDITRSLAWDGALLPGQRVNMEIIFRSKRQANLKEVSLDSCPACLRLIESYSDVFECTSCNFHFQRFTSAANVDIEAAQLVPFDPAEKPDGHLHFEHRKENEELGSFKRVRMIEQIISLEQKRDSCTDWTIEIQSGMKTVNPPKTPFHLPLPYNQTRRAYSPVYSHRTPERGMCTGVGDADPYSSTMRKRISTAPIPLMQRYSMTQRVHEKTASSSTRAMDPKAPTLKPTAADATRAGIPAGYSISQWDPSQKPILLFGSVFDANSLGKWIYDWAVYYHRQPSPRSGIAGDLWFLMMQLTGNIEQAERTITSLHDANDRELIAEFLDTSERLWDQLQNILRTCEKSMLHIARHKARQRGFNVTTASMVYGADIGCEFIDTMFGQDRQLEDTKKVMASMRLSNWKFEVYCDENLRPSNVKRSHWSQHKNDTSPPQRVAEMRNEARVH